MAMGLQHWPGLILTKGLRYGKLVVVLVCFFTFFFVTKEVSAQEATSATPKVATDELCDKGVPEFNGYQPPPVQPNPLPWDWGRVSITAVMIGLLVAGAFFFHLRLARGWLVGSLVVSLVLLGFVQHGCVCSVGSIGNILLALFHSDKYVISALVVITFFAPLIMALFAGRIFCGAVCPLGAIQELTIAFDKKVPRKIDFILGGLKYLVLAIVVYYAVGKMFFPICKYDPYVTLFRLGGSVGMWIYAAAFIVLGLFISRPFCRYLCPYGVLLGLISLIAFKKRRIDQIACVNCKKCTNDVCPVGAIVDDPPRINNFKCVACGRCNNVCPIRVKRK
jgi:polyferredoxin